MHSAYARMRARTYVAHVIDQCSPNYAETITKFSASSVIIAQYSLIIIIIHVCTCSFVGAPRFLPSLSRIEVHKCYILAIEIKKNHGNYWSEGKQLHTIFNFYIIVSSSAVL